ncbi:acetyltransferase [Vicingaceae bacterium]|nr:acetyltransferase [Vicingaceae bacterium]
MKPIVIFGIGKIADVIQYYMREESNMDVKAFTVHGRYVRDDEFNGLPIVAFEELHLKYPSNQFDVFVAVGYQDMNNLRKCVMSELEDQGYNLVSYVHPNSGVSNDIKYGKNCFIMNQVNIHPRVVLGDGVFVWSGAMIGHHSKIGSYSWITSSANIGGNVSIGENCFLALNSNVSHSIEIGNEVFLGSNTLVTQNLNDGAAVIAENHKPIKFTSKQFLKFSSFNSL